MVEAAVRDLGFTLGSALLIPDFVSRALTLDLFTRVDETQVTPVDDLKAWMRADPWRAGDLFGKVGDLLLAEERAARRAAEGAGLEFDVLAFELGRMDSENGYETFNPAWATALLRLALEEADAVQAFSRRAHEADFALAVSFELPDPRRHQRFRREDIARALAGAGAERQAAALAAGRGFRLGLEGAFQVDLSAPGGGPSLARGPEAAFVRVPIADARAGDGTVAHLSLAYPPESEGYFLMTFEALARDLSLSSGPHEV